MRLGILILLGMVASAPSLAAASPGAEEINSLFNEACSLYDASEFEGALRIFESLVSSGVRHPAVYYNLGNCYYQQGEIGKAVASYRRALSLSPRDADIRANLAFLRSTVGFQDTTSSFELGAVVRIPGEIASPKEWRIIFLAAYYLSIVCLLGVLFLGRRVRDKALRTLAVLIVVAVASWAIAEHGLARINDGKDGVVVADRSEFMSGPGDAFDELAKLPDGVEVEIRARSGIWVEVQLATGEIGWLRESALETI
jgi:tetratricopeptide (TPR) repeat protein